MAAAAPAYQVAAEGTAAPDFKTDEQLAGPSSLESIQSNPSETSAGASNPEPSLENTSTDSESCAESPEEPVEEPAAGEIRCSAVHTLDRDMPDYDYSHLVRQLRQLILDFGAQNEGMFSPADLVKCAQDDWFLARFLLRQKMDLLEALAMLKSYMRFNHESLANHLKPRDFPAEFYQLAGLFPYGCDRRGNRMLYMRVRVHRKTPEIGAIVQSFIYFNIRQLDELAQGRGIALVIDCQGAGLASADMDTLLFIISTLKNYFPKGLSYFLVHELPWILKPFWHLAKAWVPAEHRQLIKFSDSRTIYEFVEANQLPDYMGGLVAERDYKLVPEDCVHLGEAAKLWGIEREVMLGVLNKFKENLPEETVRRIEQYFASTRADEAAGESKPPPEGQHGRQLEAAS